MMNKIRNLIQKMKKPKASEVNELEQANYEEFLDETNEVEDQTTSPQNSVVEKEPAPEQDLSNPPEFENSDQDITGSLDQIDLDNGKLGFKDKLQIKTTAMKDKLNRIDFRKFKSPKFKTSEKDSKTKKDILLSTKQKFKKIDGHKIKGLHQQIFDPKYRNAIHKSFQATMIFGSIFMIGKNSALFLREPIETGATKPEVSLDDKKLLTSQEIEDIRKSGIFKTDAGKPVDTVKKPVIAQDIKCEEARRKSNLPIKLINTIVLQDSLKSLASVQVRSGRELTEVREGDKIGTMAKIDVIDRQKIIVKNLQDGRCEMIENQDLKDRPSPIALMSPSQSKAFKKNQKKIEGVENEGNKYTIEKGFIQDKMKNISDVLTQARGIQLTNPDGSLSFKIVDVEPGGIFSYLGIQNNDIITHINGKKISNLNEVMSLFGKVSNMDKMDLTISRGGEEVPLQYNIR